MTINAVTRVPAVLAFRRGDVTPGAPAVLKKTRQSHLDNIATWTINGHHISKASNFSFGGAYRAPYTQNMYSQIVATAAEERIVAGGSAAGGVYVTTSGQIKWRPQDRFTVDTPRTKMAVGFFTNIGVTLGSGIDVTVGKTMNNYAVVAISSLIDSEALPSSKMLLTLAGYFMVPGEYPRAPGQNTYSWGDDTPRIEAVPATVRMTTASNLKVTALDSAGARATNVPVVRNGAYVEFVTGPAYDTGWYLVETVH
jgi:hypothetical protein